MARIASSVISQAPGVSPVASSWRFSEIALGDLDLLLLGVAGELDDLHAVAQWPWDGVDHIGGADEHHPRQVERNREVIVAEGRVLLGVQHFEQRRRRVAVEALAELVHLVEHHHRIARLGLADRLNHVAGQRADIGPAMAADLRLVMQSAEAQRARICGRWRARSIWPSEVLPTPGGPTKQRIGLLPSGLSLRTARNSRMRCLILRQAVMVLVEDAARFGDVDALFARASTKAARSANRGSCGS